MARRYVVLLRESRINLLECDHEEVFPTAQMLEAGICGVFEDRRQAADFIEQLRQGDRSSDRTTN